MSRPTRRARSGLALVLVVLAAGMLAATAAYNNAAAPPAEHKRYAEVIPLGEGSTASATSQIELHGPAPIVTSHFVLDRDTKMMTPLRGGTPVPLLAGAMDDIAVDGDSLAWVDLDGAPTVNYYDAAFGSIRTFLPAANLTPLPGTLAAGDGAVAWSFARADGRVGAAVLPRGATQPLQFVSAFGENRTVAALLRSDLFFSKSPEGGDLWTLNTTGGQEEQVALGPGVANTTTGAFFVAWVNASAGDIQYFDVLDRVVESIAPPAEVTPAWVLANGVTILIGGTKPGFFSSSPRVEFYDFSLGVAHIYNSIGVDFDARPQFGYGDQTVVSYIEVPQARPSAPLTVWILLAALGTLGLAVAEGLRHTFGEEDDL